MAHLVAQGLLVEHNGRWSLREEAVNITMEVPESLRHMIAQQFERLRPEEQQLVAAEVSPGSNSPRRAWQRAWRVRWNRRKSSARRSPNVDRCCGRRES